MSGLSSSVLDGAVGETQTRDLSVTSPMLCDQAIKPHLH